MFNNEQDFTFDFKQFFSPLTTRKAICFIAVIGIIVYFNSLFNGFAWDDRPQILENDLTHSLSNIPKLFLGSTFPGGIGAYYRPFLSVSFTVIYSLFGAQPFFFHILQITIHILNSILLFVFFRKFFNKQLAFFLSILFLVHPINVEAVSYISALNDPMFFLFGISALLLSLREKISINRTIGISFLLLCSLLSKETGILFILLVITYRFLFKLNKRKVLLLSGTLIGVIYLYLRLFVGKVTYEISREVPIAGLSLPQRLLHIPAIIFYYVKTIVFPLQLGVWQKWTIHKITFVNFYFPLFITLIFFCLLFYAAFYLYKHDRKQIRLYIFFTMWFLSGLGLLLQIIPFDMTVSERWMYFPIVGLLGIIGIVIHTLQLKGSMVKSASILAALIILGMFSLRTIVRNTNWSDEITLFSHDVQVDDDNLKELMLAQDLIGKGMKEQAFPHFEKSIELNPHIHLKICPPGRTAEQSKFTCETLKDAVVQNFGEDVVEDNIPNFVQWRESRRRQSQSR